MAASARPPARSRRGDQLTKTDHTFHHIAGSPRRTASPAARPSGAAVGAPAKAIPLDDGEGDGYFEDFDS